MVDLERLKGKSTDKPGRWSPKSMWSAGVTGTTHRKEPLHGKPIHDNPGYAPSLEDTDKLVPGQREIQMDTERVITTFKQVISQIKGVQAPDTYKTDSDQFGGIFTLILKAFAPGNTQYPLVSLTITVCPSGVDAISGLKSRGAFLTPKDGDVEQKTQKFADALWRMSEMKIWGTETLNMYVRENWLVEIQTSKLAVSVDWVTVNFILATQNM